MEWNPNDIQSFKNLLCPDDDVKEEPMPVGSVLNPATATGGTYEQIANPNVKMTAKVYSKQTINPEIDKKEEESKKKQIEKEKR